MHDLCAALLEALRRRGHLSAVIDGGQESDLAKWSATQLLQVVRPSTLYSFASVMLGCQLMPGRSRQSPRSEAPHVTPKMLIPRCRRACAFSFPSCRLPALELP